MGRGHDARRHRRRARYPRTRCCLLKGCNTRFLARQWRERYCSGECRALAKRWSAAKRQRRRRRSPEVLERHRAAEKARRDKAKAASGCGEALERERGHAKVALLEGPICDRPGCYDAPAASRSGTAHFCCAACRRAVRRVLDREQKWQLRATDVGRLKRQLEYLRRGRRSNPIGSGRGPS